MRMSTPDVRQGCRGSAVTRGRLPSWLGEGAMSVPDATARPALTRRTVLRGGAAVIAATAVDAPAAHAGAAGVAGLTSRGQLVSLGTRLYNVVEGYSRWPRHRTGTRNESAALGWFESQLRDRGAAIGRSGFVFPYYDWAARVWVGGHEVPTIPLYYEGVGSVTSSSPFIRRATIGHAGGGVRVLAAVAEAEASNAELAVLPVSSASGAYPTFDGLVAVNREPAARTTGVPTLLIPGRLAARAARKGVRARIHARIVPRRSHNVTGWFGAPVNDPVIVTTPLSGWFTCAAERGTGIAVALKLAAELAHTHPVFFLGSSGHELGGIGVRTWLAKAFDLNPTAVIHIGASVAAGAIDRSGRFELANTRVVACNPPISAVPGLADAARLGNFRPIARFPGEARHWSPTLGPSVPLLSFSGQFPQFHTHSDRPEVTTSPRLLATAYQSVHSAARALLSHVPSG